MKLAISPVLAAYLGGGHRKVEGWLDEHSARMIAGLSLFQQHQRLSGSVGEIGVHHGRLFIILGLTRDAHEQLFAIDVFEKQELNLDRSGNGSRAHFLENLRGHGVSPESVTMLTGDSREIQGNHLRSQVGPVRLMSIDGGHTEECVRHDLQLAEEVIADHGVLILDDVFNSTWPAVVTAYARHLAEQPRTVPFATSPNKVYACRPAFVAIYQTFLRQAFGRIFDRSDRFFDFGIDGYGMWPKRTILG
ncbi:MAG: class I SAM-dependent methyltransferase [Gemmataceae bacterium]